MRILPLFLIPILPTVLPAQQVAIADYVAPNGAGAAITHGPDGALWFATGGGIGRLTRAGIFSEFHLDGSPNSIAAGPDGALWFTLPAGSGQGYVGQVTTSGDATYYGLSQDFRPTAITAGSDGALWLTFGGDTSSSIGRITTQGVFTAFGVPGDQNNAITAGPDGALWYTNPWGIGRVTTAGSATWYPVGDNKAPAGIAPGPDGALWFTEAGGNNIGRITASGVITEYPVPTAGSAPIGIAPGPDRALWFTEHQGGKLGRITVQGTITEYALPNCPCSPSAITSGPGGQLWFTSLDSQTGRVLEAAFPTATLTVTPDSGVWQSTLTFSGSGYAPDEIVNVYGRGVGSGGVARATADKNGSFTATGGEPLAPYGSRIFFSSGERSGALGAATFLTKARLFLKPKSGLPGSTVTVSGAGFIPSNGSNEIVWQDPNTALGFTGPVDSSGVFAGITVKVPAYAAPGPHRLSVIVGPGIQNVGEMFTVQ